MPVMCRRKPAGLSGATSQAHASLQAGWGKVAQWEEMLQPEDIEKQAGWRKNGAMGKMPQPEDKIKQDASFCCLEWEGRI